MIAQLNIGIPNRRFGIGTESNLYYTLQFLDISIECMPDRFFTEFIDAYRNVILGQLTNDPFVIISPVTYKFI